MAIGSTYPTESRTARDRATGALVRQVTDFPAIHHHPFFYIPAYDEMAQRLFFVSHRSGQPQVFMEERPEAALVQLTDRPDLDEWSVHPAYNGRYVYYTASGSAWRVDLENLEEEQLAQLGPPPTRKVGMVGAAMGTTSVSHDDRWWCVPIRVEDHFQMYIVDTNRGESQVVLEQPVIGHPQFHPDDANLLRYAGSHAERLWVVHRDGSNNRLVYQRDCERKEWIVHETWLPARREIMAANWPHGVMVVDIDTGNSRWIVRTNAWHPMVSCDGKQVVADTVHPDRGLILSTLDQEPAELRTLCYPHASSLGEHWKTDHCPYDDGPSNVYAPQHTHPHPSFSPDGRRVVFTSDVTGTAQVYEVQLEHD